MKRMKNEKGITLLALVIVVIVLMSISIPVVVNTTNISKVSNYSKFKDDMESLIEFVQVAYNTDTNISSIGNKVTNTSVLRFLNDYQNGSKIKSENDNDIYYVINVDTLNDKSAYKLPKLNYGTNPYGGETSYDEYDAYIINDQSWTIYYTRGVDYNGVIYYRIPDKLTLSSKPVVPGVILTEFNNVWIDKNGDKATIPVGFGVSKVESEQTIKTGLVITDKFDSNGNSIGNEWVWIPCTLDGANDSVKYERTAWTRNGWSKNQKMIDDYIKRDDCDPNCGFFESLDYKEAKSIKINKGFYMARFEAGDSVSTGKRTEYSNKTNSVSVKKDAIPYNYVSCDQAKKLSAEISTNNGYNDKLFTKLSSSYAWDTTLKFIEKTSSTYPTNPFDIGNKGSNNTGFMQSICNIYDLAGNLYEYTTENCNYPNNSIVYRGGRYGNDNDIECVSAGRAYCQLNSEEEFLGFRPTLYL